MASPAAQHSAMGVAVRGGGCAHATSAAAAVALAVVPTVIAVGMVKDVEGMVRDGLSGGADGRGTPAVDGCGGARALCGGTRVFTFPRQALTRSVALEADGQRRGAAQVAEGPAVVATRGAQRVTRSEARRHGRVQVGEGGAVGRAERPARPLERKHARRVGRVARGVRARARLGYESVLTAGHDECGARGRETLLRLGKQESV